MKKKFMQGGRIFAVGVVLACLMGLLIPAAHAARPGEIVLTVRQVLTNAGTPLPETTFSYKLAPELAANPMPAGSGEEGYVFSITGTDDLDIGPIIFTQAGKYAYEIAHITSPRPGYTCDQKVYTLEIYVKRDLDITVVARKADGSKAPDIKYEHSYKLSSDPSGMADLPVVKTVNGNPAKDSAFTFRLAAKNPTDPMPAGSADGVKTLQITGSGRGTFGTWSYTAQGTYYYTVSEVNSGESGYTYDTAVYTITDTVKAVDGQLAVTRVVTNDAKKQVTSLSFINTYTPGGGSTPPDGKPGKPGPVTGDETGVTLYFVLFCTAGIAALGSVTWLLVSRRRGRRKRNESEA